jgi:phosphohistidine phosphatase
MDDVVFLAETISPGSNQMLVGHLPFMARLTSHLVTGSADLPVFAFQNSGIVCLDREDDAPLWIIKWSLMPNIG